MLNNNQYLFDENHTRFQLVKFIPGKAVPNWLFLPGGPGVDSSCFHDLIAAMPFPGHYWLVDLIFNGTNDQYPNPSPELYQQWGKYLVEAVKRFESPILIGHSFGGFLPLFCPSLENLLHGLVILNSVPTLKSPLFAQYAKANNLPSLSEAQTLFIQKPSLASMKALYMLEAYYFFSPKNQAEGIARVVQKLEYCIATEHWWYTQGASFYSEISWVPQKVPTLILGGSDDFITPTEVFKSDLRFKRNNIEIMDIHDAGHFPWIEKPSDVNDALGTFVSLVEKGSL